MSELHHFVRVDFFRFKAFQQFTLHLKHFNILVGPNNAGKSTVLVAFRILAAALRRARTRNPEPVTGPDGDTFGYSVDMKGISVAEENIFFNYDDSEPGYVRFHLSNGAKLLLYFSEVGSCSLIADTDVGRPRSTAIFKKYFNCPIGFVPILGPVEHREYRYQEEAARLALFNYTASRNFRNIWLHYPDKFDRFRELLKETWPGMDIEPPKVDYSHDKPVLHMFCPEERIPREIFWAGFGFQVWCQMLTHLVQSDDKSLFLIDEPDIYLHSDLQRQLLDLLRNLGPDILIATHSTEIITEAEADDIVIINKKHKRSKRIKHPTELADIFVMLGSNLNPVLTQLAKTRRVVFVEGKDFQIISKFARKLNHPRVANRGDFAVVPVEGFNPERIRNLKKGMETTLGGAIAAAVILDRDYRSQDECDVIIASCQKFCDLAIVHSCKEIENFLLVTTAIDKAVERKVHDKIKRTGEACSFTSCTEEFLDDFASVVKNSVASRYLATRRAFEKKHSPGIDEVTANESALHEFERKWQVDNSRNKIIPGKDALSAINQKLQERYGVSVTPTAIIDSMLFEEISCEMSQLVEALSEFSSSKPKSS